MGHRRGNHRCRSILVRFDQISSVSCVVILSERLHSITSLINQLIQVALFKVSSFCISFLLFLLFHSSLTIFETKLREALQNVTYACSFFALFNCCLSTFANYEVLSMLDGGRNSD